jgi:hypothetical protein
VARDFHAKRVIFTLQRQSHHANFLGNPQKALVAPPLLSTESYRVDSVNISRKVRGLFAKKINNKPRNL